MIWPVGFLKNSKKSNASLMLLFYFLILPDGCNSKHYIKKTCSNYCYKMIGTICREDIENNLNWPKTLANHTVKIACDNIKPQIAQKYAYRKCIFHASSNPEDLIKSIGTWSKPDINECIENSLLNLKTEVDEELKILKSILNLL